MHNPGLNSFSIKALSGLLAKIDSVCSLYSSNIYILISWFRWLYCNYIENSSFCKEYEPKHLRMMKHNVGTLFPKSLGKKVLGTILATFLQILNYFTKKEK